MVFSKKIMVGWHYYLIEKSPPLLPKLFLILWKPLKFGIVLSVTYECTQTQKIVIIALGYRF